MPPTETIHSASPRPPRRLSTSTSPPNSSSTCCPHRSPSSPPPPPPILSSNSYPHISPSSPPPPPPIPSSNSYPHISPSSPPPPPPIPSSNPYPHISSSNSCPYTPFLSSSDAPPDCHIEIQPHSNLYYILVNLPGFCSQDITLATKRRRILHLVADKWGEGGGHFEKKVVFGYDADLTRVRAEFNGDLLTITIPRRVTSDILH